jgi:nucleoside-diphosphate-sugar epimerase
VRVLITGAGGTLGTALAPALAAAGHEPRLVDVKPLDASFESSLVDVRDIDSVRTAMSGIDYVVHAAALHGIHLRDHSPAEFFELNVKGTFNVWLAAIEAGVRGVVFSSTMGVYGESAVPRDGAAVEVVEDLPLQPADVYGFSKLAGEEMCRWFGREHRIPSVALRFGMFVPEPFFRYGIRLLYGGVDTADVVGVVMASLAALMDGRLTWDVFNVQSPLPFTREDGIELRRDAFAVVGRRFPGARELLSQRGVSSLAPVDRWFPVRRLEERLGYIPSCTFGGWLDDLRRRPDERTSKSPPWP